MAGESSAFITVGVAGSVTLLIILVAFFAIKKVKSKGKKESLKIINSSSSTWYDPQFQKLVPEQLGQGDIYIEDGLLAVFTADNRSVSADNLAQERMFPDKRSKSLTSARHLSISSQSLLSVSSEPASFSTKSEDDKRNSYTFRGSPYVEFNLLWASSSSSLSVYVVRITSLPPCYHKSTCSYKVTLHKPDNTSISKSSNKVRTVNFNPDCEQVFSFQVPLQEVRNSQLEVVVCVRKSKHFLSKAIGHLRYDVPSELTADSFVTRSQPLTLYKKGYSASPLSSKDAIVSPPGKVWGQVQILAQYQITGGWCGRVKLVIIKAQNSFIGKRKGNYKMELIVKKAEETKEVHETKLAPGPNPVWNTPFIFDVTQIKVQDYRVEMTLFLASRVKKSTAVGHVALGLNTTPSGTKHWEDLVASPNKELTVWHPVTYLEE